AALALLQPRPRPRDRARGARPRSVAVLAAPHRARQRVHHRARTLHPRERARPPPRHAAEPRDDRQDPRRVRALQGDGRAHRGRLLRHGQRRRVDLARAARDQRGGGGDAPLSMAARIPFAFALAVESNATVAATRRRTCTWAGRRITWPPRRTVSVT